MLAVISVLTPMWIVAFRPDDGLDVERINIFELWWFFWNDVSTWISVFLVLGVLRLAIIYAKEKRQLRHFE